MWLIEDKGQELELQLTEGFVKNEGCGCEANDCVACGRNFRVAISADDKKLRRSVHRTISAAVQN